MSRQYHGRHRRPADHKVGKAIVTSSIGAGCLLASTPVAAHASPSVTISASITPKPVLALPLPVVAPVVTAAPESTTYTVVSGDNLSGIASSVDKSWQDLYADNKSVVGDDPDFITPGEVLTINGTSVAPAPAPAPTPTPALKPESAASPSGHGHNAVDLARDEIGKPYVWAAAGPSAFDCSGLVQYVYRQLGVNLPHNAAAQSEIGTLVGSLADAQPGDLLFFYSPVGHVGIYVGNGQMIAAPEPGDVVKQQSVWATPSVIRRLI